MYGCLLSQGEAMKIDDALLDPIWIIAMQDELNQFERNKVRELVHALNDRSIIGTKWFSETKWMKKM